MHKLLPAIVLSLIPLSGCSSPEPELSYDPIELIEYEEVINESEEIDLTEVVLYKDYRKLKVELELIKLKEKSVR